jgi:hypothetical protein
MRINIQNLLVQQDLFEILNSNSMELGVQEDDNKVYLIKTITDGEYWLGESRYIYDNKEEALKDLETLKNIMKSIDV